MARQRKGNLGDDYKQATDRDGKCNLKKKKHFVSKFLSAEIDKCPKNPLRKTTFNVVFLSLCFLENYLDKSLFTFPKLAPCK